MCGINCWVKLRGCMSACVRVKGGVSERFGIDSGMRQGCIRSPWLFNVYIDAVMKEVKMGMGRRGARFTWPLICKRRVFV